MGSCKSVEPGGPNKSHTNQRTRLVPIPAPTSDIPRFSAAAAGYFFSFPRRLFLHPPHSSPPNGSCHPAGMARKHGSRVSGIQRPSNRSKVVVARGEGPSDPAYLAGQVLTEAVPAEPPPLVRIYPENFDSTSNDQRQLALLRLPIEIRQRIYKKSSRRLAPLKIYTSRAAATHTLASQTRMRRASDRCK